MTQKHVELLLKAIAVPESLSPFLCDRIGAVVGFFHEYEYMDYADEDFIERDDLMWELKDMIRNNINPEAIYHELSFDDTQYAKEGMTRNEWVETILVPLALELK